MSRCKTIIAIVLLLAALYVGSYLAWSRVCYALLPFDVDSFTFVPVGTKSGREVHLGICVFYGPLIKIDTMMETGRYPTVFDDFTLR